MPFTKGYSGNLNGRPPGSLNKTAGQLRKVITEFLEQKFDQVIEDFEQLEPKERIKVFTELLQYSVPKMQAVANSIEFEKPDQQPFSDQQVDRLIQSLNETKKEDWDKIKFREVARRLLPSSILFILFFWHAT